MLEERGEVTSSKLGIANVKFSCKYSGFPIFSSLASPTKILSLITMHLKANNALYSHLSLCIFFFLWEVHIPKFTEQSVDRRITEFSFLWKVIDRDPAKLLAGTGLKIAVSPSTSQVSEVHLLKIFPIFLLNQKPFEKF